jgi:tagatose-1,6-bisphosphate aldolase
MVERPVLSPGKARGLAAASTEQGVFTILAVDHRDSLRTVLAPDAPSTVPAEEMTAVKLDLLRMLGGGASAALLDPEYSAAQAIVTGALPGNVAFLVAIEAQGYLGDPSVRRTSLLEGWGVAKVKRLGASGVKMLVLYHPDGGAVTEAQERLIESVIAQCSDHDIPLFLEPLAYSTDPAAPIGSAAFADRHRAVVVNTVRRLGALGPDVLKVQFPVDCLRHPDRAAWADACAELDETTPVPWALLSGGDSYDLFREQVRVACSAGASGFLVGRALWGPYVTTRASQRTPSVTTLLRDRFLELSTIAVEHGRSWRDRFTMPPVTESWYRGYGAATAR